MSFEGGNTRSSQRGKAERVSARFYAIHPEFDYQIIFSSALAVLRSGKVLSEALMLSETTKRTEDFRGAMLRNRPETPQMELGL